MGAMSISHWIIVMVVILLVASTGRLKNIGKEIGETIKGFKESVKGEQSPQEKK